MIKVADMKEAFVGDLGWKPVDGLPGEFSVSPDTGILRRVYSSDVKIRRDGRMLLGVIGIFSPYVCSGEFSTKLGLSAYITNFEELSCPPILQSHGDLKVWVRVIADCVNKLPRTAERLVKEIAEGDVGPFEARIFLESTPWGPKFVECLKLR